MTDSYIGVPPKSGFINTAKQRVTSSTNNYVDLDHAISDLSDVIIWVNSIKQDSTNLSLTNPSKITLGGTLTASDVCEIVYLGKQVATQSPDTGSVTNSMLAGSIGLDKLSATGTKSSSTFLRGDNSFAEAGGGTNTPYFFASCTSNQSITHDTTTKCNYDRADVDSASGYDTTNKRYTIPSGKGGYWHIGYSCVMGSGGEYVKSAYVYPKKNGSDWPSFNSRHQGVSSRRADSYPFRNIAINKSFIANISAGEYIEIHVNYGDTRGGGNTVDFNEYYSCFWGYKLVE